jgi:hypothetical protein
MSAPALSSSGRASPTKKLSDDAVLDEFFALLKRKDIGWSLYKLLATIFAHPKSRDNTRNHTHRAYVQHLLNGSHPVHELVALMVDHPSAKPKQSHEEHQLYYSLSTPPDEIAFASPAITAYMAQRVLRQMQREIGSLAQPENGLRVRATQKTDTKSAMQDDDSSKSLIIHF